MIWDVIRDYILKTKDDKNVLHLKKTNHPKLLGVANNPGIEKTILEPSAIAMGREG